jgi:hypothetical protein
VALEETDTLTGGVRFFRREGNALREIARSRYAGEPLAQGAAISADAELYACGVRAVAARARVLTMTYDNRIAAVSSQEVNPACLLLLSEADDLMGGALSEETPEGFLVAMFSAGTRLSQIQSALRAASCPVIA